MIPFLAPIASGWTWLTNNKLARNIAIGVATLIALFIGYKVWKGNVEKGVRRQMREAQEREQAETRADMIERTSTIITEERRNADEALQARDGSNAPATYDELSDDQKRVAEGRFRVDREGGS